jgi:hypothetical protein
MSRWDSLKPSSGDSSARSSKSRHSRRRNQDEHGSGDSSRYHSKAPSGFQGSRGEKSFAVDSSFRKLKNALARQNNLVQGNSVDPSIILSSLEEIETSIIDCPSTERVEIFSLCIEILEKEFSSCDKLIVSILEKILLENTPQLSETQARHGVSVLSRRCQGQENITFLRPLALLVRRSVSVLPAESTAHTVVGRIFFPCLEQSLEFDNKLPILNAVSALLRDSQHASALLGSLVLDVTNDGTEQIVVNPLRSRLVTILQTITHNPDEQPDLKSMSCRTLSQVIGTLNKIDPNCSLSTICLDLPAAESYILSTFDERQFDLFEPCLVLLHSLILHHPNSISKLLSKLVLTPNWDGRDRNLACRQCNTKYFELGVFMQCVHFETSRDLGIDKSVSNLAVACLAECIKSMPWKHWLGLHTAPSVRSGFGRRLADSLAVVMKVTRCNFLSCDDDSAESLSRLTKQIFLEIPFGEEKLTERAVDLLATVADVAFGNARMPTLKETAFAALIHSMGGWETPQGEMVPMCLPTQRWLSQQVSLVILNSSFESVKSNDNNADVSVRFLSAILRTRPETVLQVTTEFSEIIHLGLDSDNANTRLRVLGLLDAFMLGRKNSICELDILDSESTVRIALSILKKTRGDERVQCRCLAFNTYASLLAKDWITVERDGENIFNDHFHSIILHCRESNTKVKRSACKALAEFCTAYFSNGVHLVVGNDDTGARATAQSVSKAMLEAMDDKNAAVRAVVHFCIGNLAYSIRETSSGSLLDDSTLLRVCTKVQEALQDPNDKVISSSNKNPVSILCATSHICLSR